MNRILYGFSLNCVLERERTAVCTYVQDKKVQAFPNRNSQDERDQGNPAFGALAAVLNLQP